MITLSGQLYLYKNICSPSLSPPTGVWYLLTIWSLYPQCQWSSTSSKDLTTCRGLEIWWLINMVILNQFSAHRNPLPAFTFGWGGKVMVGIYLITHFISGYYQGDHSFILKTLQKITDLNQLFAIALIVVVLVSRRWGSWKLSFCWLMSRMHSWVSVK